MQVVSLIIGRHASSRRHPWHVHKHTVDCRGAHPQLCSVHPQLCSEDLSVKVCAMCGLNCLIPQELDWDTQQSRLGFQEHFQVAC